MFYPIIDLKSSSLGVSDYIRLLESIGIELLERYNVRCERRKGLPGLWLDENKKIASIGVRIRRWVTYHGMAINMNNDLSIFDMIKPCGLDNVTMTSLLTETNRQVPMTTVKDSLKELLIKYFA